ncbi:MAG TPA: aspartate--tRNA ligase [Polyangiaceae bacterium]|nr:aspartate--tRNA ligase [Polyangiaceae bacterium]
MTLHRYRSHNCNELTQTHVGREVRLSGWVHKKRDHGNLLFVDLRDHFGLTQLVAEKDSASFAELETLKSESVICVTGQVAARDANNVNPNLATGQIEVRVSHVEVLTRCNPLPFPIATDQELPEEQRLAHRYLDLRRQRMHANIVRRSEIIASVRRRMIEAGFLELQTPILTASSPEGARDYLVPSRVYPGKFFALPQAPQMFKQLFMVAGFNRYFQIAPCFRDEDARADRSPGEFYQLDVELSFVTQDDVFSSIEPILSGLFSEFSTWKVTQPPFERITYADSMQRFGSDKPDLRNPLELRDVTALFKGSDFKAFADAAARGETIRALKAPNVASKPRSFFDNLVSYAQSLGAGGLAYVVLGDQPKGPIAKFLAPATLAEITQLTGAAAGDAIFFIAGTKGRINPWSAALRSKLGEVLELIDKEQYRFCWITDFPMYERDEATGKIQFSHNPFSMPKGELEALQAADPTTIVAQQYDIVCNGVELSSGAIRNHRPDLMVKAFEIAGYTATEVEKQFGALFQAFHYGPPPHGGLAPGIDRMVWLLTPGEQSIREIIAFPLAQTVRDLMMGAPSEVREEQLKELHIRVVPPPPKPEAPKS